VEKWQPFEKIGARDIPRPSDIFEKNFRVRENPPKERKGMNGPIELSGGLLASEKAISTRSRPVGKQPKPTGRLS
jgi:hypothetical protein